LPYGPPKIENDRLRKELYSSVYPDITTRTSKYNDNNAPESYSLDVRVAMGQSKPHKPMDLMTIELDPNNTREVAKIKMQQAIK
jgi:hypothetical protein